MWTIRTVKDSSLGPHGETLFTGEYEAMRKKWFKLVRTYGNIFTYSFN